MHPTHSLTGTRQLNNLSSRSALPETGLVLTGKEVCFLGDMAAGGAGWHPEERS